MTSAASCRIHASRLLRCCSPIFESWLVVAAAVWLVAGLRKPAQSSRTAFLKAAIQSTYW